MNQSTVYKIFIDQGHNPQNPNAGAEANGVREQDVTYEVGIRLAELLRENPNFEVRLSRNSPTEQLGTSNATSLAARVNAANSWGADYFISLHCNASTVTTASGSEALCIQRGQRGLLFGRADSGGSQLCDGAAQSGREDQPEPVRAPEDPDAGGIGGDGVSDEPVRCRAAFIRSPELCAWDIQRYSGLSEYSVTHIRPVSAYAIHGRRLNARRRR